jgi:hypothetical protein
MALPFRPKGGKRDRAPGLAGMRSTDGLRKAKKSGVRARDFPPCPARTRQTSIDTHEKP